MDKATVCTMALRLIGEYEYEAQSSAWNACEVYYKQALDELAAGHDWSFFRRRAVLTKNEEGEYEIPFDCIRIVQLRGLRNWRIYGTMIRPDSPYDIEGEVEMIYTSNCMSNRGEVPDTVPEFVHALVARLAGYLAAALAANQQLRLAMEQECEVWLDRAMTHDTQGDNSNDQHPLKGLLARDILY